jgi:hypothetical protein
MTCAVDGHEREPALELRHIAAHLDTKKHKGHTQTSVITLGRSGLITL